MHLANMKNISHLRQYRLIQTLGRAGVPMEVMGLMLGQFVDDYTITCVDVFAMPQVCSNQHLKVTFDGICSELLFSFPLS